MQYRSNWVRSSAITLTMAGLCSQATAQCTLHWSPEFATNPAPFTPKSLAIYDAGRGDALYAGGAALGPFDPDRIGMWDSATWSAVGGGIAPASQGFCGCGAQVYDLHVFDPGIGSMLFAGGSFIFAGGVETGAIARFDGIAWNTVGKPLLLDGCADCPPTVNAILDFDDGNGPNLYAGGWFVSSDGVILNHVGRFNGSAWSPLGSGMSDGGFVLNAQVYALDKWNDGTGEAIYAGGQFDTAGGTRTSNIARWTGTAWQPLGCGTNGQVRAITHFNDGSTDMLVVAGDFTQAGGLSVRNIAMWDGTTWHDPAGGLNGRVNALAVFDDGSGPALYAAGAFTFAGGVVVGNVAKWDGTGWSDLSFGVDGEAFAIEPGNIRGPGLYVGGDFTTAGARDSKRIARWVGCQTCYPDCDQSTGAGVLDIFDFLCFQDSFVNGASYACDCDTSTGRGTCDIFDFLCFQNAFVAGCP
jgi:hypothetical protein